jgi:DNA-binding transcriptional MocR family regulator
MLQSAAWRSLSPVARCIFLELAAIYNGSNNGRLALSARDAAERVRCSKNTAARAFAELTQKGFIDLCSRGHFDRKTPHAAEYRLTMHPCDRSGERASKRFMSWHPEQPKSVAGPTRGTAGVTTGTVTSVTKENCRELSLSRDRKPHLEVISGPTTDTHIIYQRG